MDELLKMYQDLLTAPEISRLQALSYWSYVLLALLVFIEGPIATFLAAAAASAGWLNPVLVFIAAATGNLLADTLWYLLGYFSQIDWLFRHKRWIKLDPDYIAELKKEVRNHTPRILFVAKLTYSLIIPALIAAGLARVPWRRWAWALAGGELIWTGSLTLLGYYLGQSLKRLEAGLQIMTLTGIVIILVMLGRYYLRRKS